MPQLVMCAYWSMSPRREKTSGTNAMHIDDKLSGTVNNRSLLGFGRLQVELLRHAIHLLPPRSSTHACDRQEAWSVTDSFPAFLLHKCL